MKEEAKIKLGRALIRLWNELKIFLEYLVRMPIIESKAIPSTIKKIFKELWELFRKPVLVFYGTVLFTAYLLRNLRLGIPVNKSLLLKMFFLCFLTFIWLIISGEEWREYYRKKYFYNNYKKIPLKNNK